MMRIMSRFSSASEKVLASFEPQIRSFWAKTPEDSTDKSGDFLSVPQHLVDAACVADELWETWLSNQTRAFLRRETSMTEQALRSLVTFVVGTHDIGKISCTFQSQLDSRGDMGMYSQRVEDAGFSLVAPKTESAFEYYPHSSASEAILFDWLLNHKVSRPVGLSIASIAAAHHGVPSTKPGVAKAARAMAKYSAGWKAAHKEILDKIAELTGFNEVLQQITKPLTTPATQIITGFVIMCDWIASNQMAFPLNDTHSQEDRVRRGVDSIELSSPWSPQVRAPQDATYFSSAFNWPDSYKIRPIQQAAVDIARAQKEPTLLIIEAATGEGKTEAGLAAAHVLAAHAGSQGIVFAAPTMSTADGLFNRVTDWAMRTTPESEVSTMFLGHSKSSLNRDFTKLRFGSIGDRHEFGTVTATRWLAGRKRGILSNFVVCTVDQVLMLALQARHLMLRHLGFSGKVVIIDEAHSYDVYMNEYLAVAIQWLARYGCSVIIMSATLPTSQRQALASAYAKGLNIEKPTVRSSAYPLLTIVDKQGGREQPVETRPESKHYSVEKLADDGEAVAGLLEDKLREGGVALVVCNTVRRAQEAFDKLSARFPGEVELHHAAFMASHRARKEEELRRKLGPHAHRGNGRPDRLVVVATQVAEQSLDIDADLLVTDIAPMDLLIQRIGRVYRHNRPASDRPEPVSNAQVYIRGVETWDPVPEFEAGTAAVYSPAILFATTAVAMQTLFARGFTSPSDVSELVQKTYSPALTCPDGWEEQWNEAAKQHAQAIDLSRARADSYRIPEPRSVANERSLQRLYERIGPKESAENEEAKGLAQVRDSTPTVEVIPIVSTEYGYIPLALPESPDIADDAQPERHTAFALAASSVRLPSRLTPYDTALNKVLDQLEMDTPVGWVQDYQLKGEVALRLNAEHEIELNGHLLRYDMDLGLLEVFPGENYGS